ncbi:MAG: hypothetical protein CMJ64_09635 [Planctomycetaceae bacterium]|nr:hypothetical protein [Planctomycetaceae bacterium]
MDDDRFQLDPPIHLVTGEAGCWRCGGAMPVVAILCENVEAQDEGPYILSNTAEPPAELTTFIQRRCPTYRLTYSKTVGGKYFANNCPQCGVISGDFYLIQNLARHFSQRNQARLNRQPSRTCPSINHFSRGQVAAMAPGS